MPNSFKSQAIVLGVLASAVLLAPTAFAAKLSLTPANKEYTDASPIVLTLKIDNQGECINAGDVSIVYPKEFLEPIDTATGGSIFTLWINSPSIYKDFGLVSFVGGIPNGYCGRTSGDPSLTNIIGKVIFRFTTSTLTSAKPVSGQVKIAASSKILLHNGRGTEAKLTTQGATVTFAKKNGGQVKGEWTQALQDDTTPPEPFQVEIFQDPLLLDGQRFAVFSTTDKQTGIDHYEIFEGNAGAQWKKESSPYVLSDQNISGSLKVKAFDKAGNQRLAEYAPEIPSTTPTPNNSKFYLLALSLVVILGALIRFIPW